MSIKLVVFDIAGTTVADEGNINDVFRKAFSNVGIAEVEVADVDEVMGYRKKEAIEIIVEKYKPGYENDVEFIETIHRDFNNQMVLHYETYEGLVPLPYAERVFRELQNNKVKVALNTGFTRTITTPILKRLGWDAASFIDEVICSDEVSEGRPHPFMIEKLMQKLNISFADDVAKVGDTKVDIEEGRNAGCGIVVSVTTGAYTKDQLVKYQPDYIIDSLEFLPSLIL
ncbi:HAD-IA family hydrolase [Ginsengibacter hankyongi]|uniref:HAD-IA family hydrolase n=1 Tax=Ginsengibacter hankyongi TaxID=2607284 RepID=A0A5J5IJ92_9BACT|nr:HAD-IA family hydrolase [Ginsengibacter hankyongi]KAA9041120.1 HAD-IA family hydrolase [Ginsengibacter hankyongi]